MTSNDFTSKKKEKEKGKNRYIIYRKSMNTNLMK